MGSELAAVINAPTPSSRTAVPALPSAPQTSTTPVGTAPSPVTRSRRVMGKPWLAGTSGGEIETVAGRDPSTVAPERSRSTPSTKAVPQTRTDSAPHRTFLPPR
jgi:hypothetical protein